MKPVVSTDLNDILEKMLQVEPPKKEEPTKEELETPVVSFGVPGLRIRENV